MAALRFGKYKLIWGSRTGKVNSCYEHLIKYYEFTNI